MIIHIYIYECMDGIYLHVKIDVCACERSLRVGACALVCVYVCA